ncbi:hypothetical protein V8G54_011984 [Vigna mungo]|uniref:Uncharacterized protein n=1 Tax=Vigna mungo TaxID=3915 RepID=A0AAQ3S2X8_VIGMU
MVCGYSDGKTRTRKKGNLEGHHRCLFIGSGQVGYQRMEQRSLTGIGTKHVKISGGFSYDEGNGIARDIVDDGVWRFKGPCDGASKREKVLECERKRELEIGKNGVKEGDGCVGKLIEENTFDWGTP